MFVQGSGNRTGNLLVFLHGGGVSGWMWDKQIRYFSQNYHVLVPDLPGHGQSEEGSGFSIRGSAQELTKRIEKASEQRVIVVGFSLGAQITLEILNLRPDLIDYAVINSALVRPMPFARSLIAPIVKSTSFLVRNRSFARLQAKELSIGNEYFETYFSETKRIKSETLIKVLKENMTYTLPENFKQARAKILVTVGQKEKRIMKNSALEIVRGNQNCKGIMFPGVKHGIPLAQPDLYNETVEAWINESPLPSGLRELTSFAK